MRLFGRWGGVKFVGIFSIRQPVDASVLGEEMRVAVANTQVRSALERLSVTASVGVAIVAGDDTVESLVERAVKLMYSSKFSGKNRAVADC